MDVTTLGLPPFDDEQKLFDDKAPAETARRWRSCGVAELAVKLGGDGCLLASDGIETHVRTPEPVEPVDTTAAGDAFNAAYMAARLTGHAATDAARAGHRVAGAVVRHRGAIIPREATPSLADALS
jgi:2-dehydro-3-deoxygluconokinase